MYKIVALFGKAGAGKDTVVNKFCEKYGDDFNKIISCTTRPPRDYEVNGVDYHFLTDTEFLEKVANGDMLEATEFRGWFYGTSASSLSKDKINIGVFNPEGILNIMETASLTNSIKVLPIEIWASDKERLIRQLNREEHPDCREICRRYNTDEDDFAKFYAKADFPCNAICNRTIYIDNVLNSIADLVKCM